VVICLVQTCIPTLLTRLMPLPLTVSSFSKIQIFLPFCLLQAVSSLTSVSVAGVDLPIADSMKVLGVTLNHRLTLDNYVSAVAGSCNYHARAIRHVRHLLTVDLAQTLACSLILSRIDYCNAVIHSAPSGTIQKLQLVQNNAARVVLQAPRRSHANSLSL